MNISKEIISDFVNNYKGEHLATDLAGFLQQIQYINTEKFKLMRERENFKEKHNQDLARLKVEEIKLHKSCPHPRASLHYHGDPSGGNDSWTECTLCGGEI